MNILQLKILEVVKMTCKWTLIFDSYKDDYLDLVQEPDYYIIVGTLGLWDGQHTIFPEGIYDTLEEAVKRCWGRGSSLRLYSGSRGEILTECSHHDGCNEFYIKKLSKLGLKRYYRGLSVEEICNLKGSLKNGGRII